MNEKEYNKSIKDALKDAKDAQDKDFLKLNQLSIRKNIKFSNVISQLLIPMIKR